MHRANVHCVADDDEGEIDLVNRSSFLGSLVLTDE